MPLSLLVILTVLMLSRIAFVSGRVQHALAEAARTMSAHAYLLSVTGLDDLSDEWSRNRSSAAVMVAGQKETLLGFAESLGNLAADAGATQNAGSIDGTGWTDLLRDSVENGEALVDAASDVAADPVGEARMLAALFLEPLAQNARNAACGMIGKTLAEQVLSNELDSAADPFASLGIASGRDGLDMRLTQAFIEDDCIELVAVYTLRIPDPFALLPDMRMSNRVKVHAWMSGHGDAVRNAPAASSDSSGSQESDGQEAETSIWNAMDRAGEYRNRGREIENSELLQRQGLTGPDWTLVEQGPYGAHVDCLTWNGATGEAEAIQVFTLNPFLASYDGKPAAIRRKVRENVSRLEPFDLDMANEFAGTSDIRSLRRVVILIVPENAESWVDAAVAAEAEVLNGRGIDEVRIVRGYGAYSEADAAAPVETGSTGEDAGMGAGKGG